VRQICDGYRHLNRDVAHAANVNEFDLFVK
jgi:hypothetical protein